MVKPTFPTTPTASKLATFILTAVRHGNTTKPIDGDDLSRVLTPLGKEQGQKMGRILADRPFDLVLVSSAKRAQETAAEILQYQPWVDVIPLEELYIPEGPDKILIDEMFDELGYAPLSVYRKHQHAAALTRYAAAFYMKIGTIMKEKYGSSVPENLHIGVFGHAVFLNAIVAHREDLYETDSAVELALDTVLGETEALRITEQGSEIVSAEHITL